MDCTAIKNDILRDENLKPTLKVVLLVLKTYYNDKVGYCYPGHDVMMKDCNIRCKETLVNALNMLDKMGYINLGELFNR